MAFNMLFGFIFSIYQLPEKKDNNKDKMGIPPSYLTVVCPTG